MVYLVVRRCVCMVWCAAGMVHVHGAAHLRTTKYIMI
jgi:hypothetical protein